MAIDGITSTLVYSLLVLTLAGAAATHHPEKASSLDAQVSAFLDQHRHSWRDLNVPYQDGKILHDLVIQGNFKNILEIGTSTGHSTIWLAWAAAKTGGRVTTIEIDRARYATALRNFEKAGVGPYIDARLGDAHTLAPALEGPFDFVFCDADKEWYLRYFLAVKDKLSPRGCYTAHNVLHAYAPEIGQFLATVKRDPEFTTRIERGSGEGISVSCRVGRPGPR